MVARLPRLLLAFSSSLMAFGGTMHALAFHRTLSAIAASKLAPFFGNTLKLLWLGDSATMFVLAAIFGLLAVRPAVATRPLVLLVALVPAATAVLIYVFQETSSQDICSWPPLRPHSPRASGFPGIEVKAAFDRTRAFSGLAENNS